MSNPQYSDEARALAMKGLYVTMNQSPSQRMGGGMIPGRKGKIDPTQAIRQQLSDFPIEAKPSRPAAQIPPMPQVQATGALAAPSIGAATPTSLGDIPVMGKSPR